MHEKLKEVSDYILDAKYYILDAWENAPWIRAAGILGVTIGGLAFLNSKLPSEIAVDITNSEIKKSAPTVIIVLYFFLVSIFSGDRLRFEKKLRLLEQNFKYDNRGTLYNGGEPNIAFRLTTFKGILEGVSTNVDAEDLSEALISTGKVAAVNFANNIEEIYNCDVAQKKAKREWSKLKLADKFNQWADYDSSTGWGIVACTTKKNNVKVVINHLHGMFEGEGGRLFGHFLAGYCETIISLTIESHEGGKYHEYTGGKLLNINQSDKYTLELNYALI